MSLRVVASGRSTKKISSNRPLRSNSGGNREMSFAVATRNTGSLRSDIHVSSVPRIRFDTPPSPPDSSEASPFSISSIHSTQGDMRAAPFSASRRLRSVSPVNLLYSVAKSSRSSGSFHAPATDFAARLLPLPCTPSSRMPLGGGSPSVPCSPANTARRRLSQRLRLGRPPTWPKLPVSSSTSSTPAADRLSLLNCTMRSTSAMFSAPSSSSPWRISRRASSTGMPVRCCVSSAMAAGSPFGLAPLRDSQSCASSRTICRMRAASGSANSKRAVRWCSSGGSSSFGLTNTSVRGHWA